MVIAKLKLIAVPGVRRNAMSDEKEHGSGSVEPGDTSKRVGAEVIRERGVDPEELREKLIDAIGAEFTTYYYYRSSEVHC